ncbi:hypothetical protein QP166_05070 [Sphingomonas sp. LR60]|uniref:hypothetical protein n=1 Tax=Sphingomonas sp. LR60 TaxID=3050233 RepID=UPI002FE07407
MSGDALPTTLAAWERALVDHFLRLGECGDASPLRSFEITGETLAAVFPDAAATAGQAEEAFRTAVRTDPRVFDAFRSGTPRIAGTTRPECFAYLCASLLIDTLLDGAYSGQGQFRERLKIWLGTSRTMMQLPGIASMWHDLEHWLEARLAAGEPFRRLVLPDPRSWTQIGHTRRLSFPTRSDVRFLEKALANFPRGASDPPGLIRAIEAAIARDGASWGMESAFAEFRDAFRGGGASTGHRFWRLVLRAANNRSAGDGPNDVSLRIEFDEDGRAGLRLDGSPVVTLAAAMRAIPVVRSGNLAAAAQRGVVFFRQTGMASWAAESDPPPGRVHVGVAPTHAAVARGTNAAFAPNGDWLLTAAPVPPGTVDDLLARLQLSRLRRERLIDVSVEGGVSTGSGMLGRRRFLPRIVAAGRASAVREVVERGLSPPSARCDGGQIAADADLDGSYELSVSSGTSGDAPEWTRRVRFYRDAAPHGELGRAAERGPAVAEWLVDQVEGEGALPSPSVLPPIVWEGGLCGVGDLLEAVYASGRSGLGDAEIIDLVSRAGAPLRAGKCCAPCRSPASSRRGIALGGGVVSGRWSPSHSGRPLGAPWSMAQHVRHSKRSSGRWRLAPAELRSACDRSPPGLRRSSGRSASILSRSPGRWAGRCARARPLQPQPGASRSPNWSPPIMSAPRPGIGRAGASSSVSPPRVPSRSSGGRIPAAATMTSTGSAGPAARPVTPPGPRRSPKAIRSRGSRSWRSATGCLCARRRKEPSRSNWPGGCGSPRSPAQVLRTAVATHIRSTSRPSAPSPTRCPEASRDCPRPPRSRRERLAARR